MTHAFIGRMVLYRLTAEDALATNTRREDALRNIDKMHEERTGYQAHVGPPVREGDLIAMLITRVGVTQVAGQAFLDGNDSLWVTEAMEGDEPGQWEAITDG